MKHLENIDIVWNDLKMVQSDINASEEKIDDIKKQIEKEKKEIKNLSSNNEDIFKELSNRIVAIENFQTDIQSQEHLNDIDEIWEMVSKNAEDIHGLIMNIEDLSEKIAQNYQEYLTLSKNVKGILALEHLNDIDTIWRDVKNHKSAIAEIMLNVKTINTELLSAKDTISDLVAYKAVLTEQEHITDIDDIYNIGMDNTQEIKQLQEKSTSLISDLKGVEKLIEENKKQNQEIIEQLKAKIKVAYYVAGGASGIAIIGFVLAIIGGL